MKAWILSIGLLAAAPARAQQAPVMNDGSQLAVPANAAPPPQAAPAPPADRRPFYLAAGLVAFAAIAYWNRKQRRSLDDDDREPRAAGRDRVRRARRVTRDAEGQADADDLHAAARANEVPDDDT